MSERASQFFDLRTYGTRQIRIYTSSKRRRLSSLQTPRLTHPPPPPPHLHLHLHPHSSPHHRHHHRRHHRGQRLITRQSLWSWESLLLRPSFRRTLTDCTFSHLTIHISLSLSVCLSSFHLPVIFQSLSLCAPLVPFPGFEWTTGWMSGWVAWRSRLVSELDE